MLYVFLNQICLVSWNLLSHGAPSVYEFNLYMINEICTSCSIVQWSRQIHLDRMRLEMFYIQMKTVCPDLNLLKCYITL